MGAETVGEDLPLTQVQRTLDDNQLSERLYDRAGVPSGQRSAASLINRRPLPRSASLPNRCARLLLFFFRGRNIMG